MKKILAIILISLSLLSTNIFVFANENEDNSHDVIKIGYVMGYGGIRDVESIQKKGYFYDLFQRMSNFCDYSFEFVEYPSFDELVQASQNNEIDYFGPILKSETNQNKYALPIELSNAVVLLATNKDRPPLYYDDPDSIDGKTVASYNGSILEPYLDAYCKENNISIQYVRGTINNYHELKADYYLISSIDYKFFDYPTAINLTTQPLCIATANENTEINKIVTHAFQQTLSCDANFLYELHEKYYGNASSQRRSLTRKEKELLKNRTFKVAFNSEHDFFTYFNENGEPDGFLIDLFNHTMAKHEIDFEFLPYQMDGTGNNSVEYIVENADIVLSSIGKYKDFRYDFSTTDPYLTIPHTLLVDKSLFYHPNDNTKAKIGIVRNMFMSPDATEGQPFEQEFIIYDDVSQLYIDYNQDKIDGFYISEYATCCAESHISRDFFILPTNASTSYKLWISNKLSKDYITLANVIFDHMDASKINELLLSEQDKYQAHLNLGEFLQEHLPTLAFIIGLIILGICLLVIWTQRQKQREIKTLIEVDSLTGLMSRYKFVNELETLLKTATPNEYLLVLLDIDDFKNINKTYGTGLGDEILIGLSEVLKENSRSFIHISRLQNDNFILLLRNNHDNWTSVEQLNEYNENFEDNLKNNFEQKLQKFNIETTLHFSVGIYLIQNPSEKVDYMIDCVVVAKNMGKKTFGNTTTLFTDEIKQSQLKKYEIVSTMEKAIENEEFFIQIQPKVELDTGSVIGGEVLVRWKKPDGSYIYPDEFIPLFEQNNFIIQLDLYVLEKTCAFIQQATTDLPIISINVSASTMLRKSFISTYLSVLEKYNLHPSQLEIELTESVLDSNYVEISKNLKELKSLGFAVAIDDFGKGASSLARIRELDMDVLKLDKDFIDDNVTNERGKRVLANLISLANDLGAMTLAEGVETKEQQDMLVELGCNLGQGYLFNRALSLNDFIQCLIDNK